jgi:hypothetical protein
MDFLDKIFYKLGGRKVPVFQVMDVDDEHGKIKSMSLLKWVKRPNSLLETWNVIGAEIDTDAGPIEYIDESGLRQLAFVEYLGKTCNLFTEPRYAPNLEKVIGSAATIDDIAEALDIGRSMKNFVIGGLLGIILGWWLIAPIWSGVMK